MTRTRSTLWLALVVLLIGSARLFAGRAQPPQLPSWTPPIRTANNPHLGNAQSIRSGMACTAIRCGDCHGLDASGYRGPDLRALMAGDMTDERLFQTRSARACRAPRCRRQATRRTTICC